MKYTHRKAFQVKTPENLEARFWAKVTKSEGCWLWKNAPNGRDKSGYGMFWATNEKSFPAHRMSYELAFGPIPKGMHVCHHCDVPLCVRPDHLFLGTAAENCADKVAKGRQARGMMMSITKLDPDCVATIRAVAGAGAGPYGTGAVTRRQLARWFGVAHGTINAIVNNKTHRQLGGTPVTR